MAGLAEDQGVWDVGIAENIRHGQSFFLVDLRIVVNVVSPSAMEQSAMSFDVAS